jgi:uncharacterized pyridoxamine 5'-phosphate oxidase family protein
LSAECAKYDAIWSASKGDCTCKAGWHEDASLGRCVLDTPPPAPKTEVKTVEVTKTEPVVTTPEKVDVVAQEDVNKNLISQERTQADIDIQSTENVFENVDAIMATYYNNQPVEVQQVIIESKPVLSELSKETFKPALDLSAIVEENNISFKEPIVKLTEILPIVERQEVQQQISTFSNFGDNSEVMLVEKK